MAELVRHRQTKGPATDRPHLTQRVRSRLYTSSFAAISVVRFALIGTHHRFERENCCSSRYPWCEDFIDICSFAVHMGDAKQIEYTPITEHYCGGPLLVAGRDRSGTPTGLLKSEAAASRSSAFR
jgi:hypothetical protein